MKTYALSIAAAALMAGAVHAAPANQERPTDLTTPPPPPLAASADAYMKLIGVDGETKAVAVKSLQWSAMPRSGCSGTLGPGSMIIGAALPGETAGKHIKKAVLFVRKSGSGAEAALTVEMEDVFVTSIAPRGPTAPGASAAATFRVEYRSASWSAAGGGC